MHSADYLSIQSVEDAQHAVDIGVDGIVVSNHAGRQVDGAIASLDALENIINAGIGEKITVMFDSGFRGASDVIKALCLGAKFVWVGRMWVSVSNKLCHFTRRIRHHRIIEH